MNASDVELGWMLIEEVSQTKHCTVGDKWCFLTTNHRQIQHYYIALNSSFLLSVFAITSSVSRIMNYLQCTGTLANVSRFHCSSVLILELRIRSFFRPLPGPGRQTRRYPNQWPQSCSSSDGTKLLSCMPSLRVPEGTSKQWPRPFKLLWLSTESKCFFRANGPPPITTVSRRTLFAVSWSSLTNRLEVSSWFNNCWSQIFSRQSSASHFSEELLIDQCCTLFEYKTALEVGNSVDIAYCLPSNQQVCVYSNRPTFTCRFDELHSELDSESKMEQLLVCPKMMNAL